jgi:hypothetical protein
MVRVNPLLAGLAFAAFALLIHLMWAVLVAAGLAQPLVDFVFHVHFLGPALKVAPFELQTAIMLLGYAVTAAFVGGALLAFSWNSLVARSSLG